MEEEEKAVVVNKPAEETKKKVPVVTVPAVDEPAVPEVELVFDGSVAEKWLHSSNERKFGVFASIRFEPKGMPEKQVNFLLEMAARAIAKEVKRKRVVIGEGVLYVPLDMSKNPVLDSFVRGKRVGKYLEVRLP